MKRDKLDRWRTAKTAVSTLHCDVPFYCTLTARERTIGTPHELTQFFTSRGDDRREFRCHVRNLCNRKRDYSTAQKILASRYSSIIRRYNERRDHPAYRLAVARGWVLRCGHHYGVVCVQ